jgi:hypothetical protein
MSGRQQWLKSVDDSLKTHPRHFWKYVSNFKRKYNSFIQLKIDNQFVTDPKHVADAFANYFKSVFNKTCPSVTLLDPLIGSERVGKKSHLLLLLQGYRLQACFRLRENASSHLAMGRPIFRYPLGL